MYSEFKSNEIWEEKFPEVSFTDKVVVLYNDGSLEKIKHLYLDENQIILHEIDWDEVAQCFDV